MKGKLIVVEGVDCSGKYTQVELLCERLNNDGIPSVSMSFPMYETATGKIVSTYLGRENISPFIEGASHVDPYVSSLYFIADRLYNVDLINSKLDSGINVILDRYTLSNMAYQGSKINDKNERLKFYKDIELIENDILKLPKADMCLFLNVSLDYIKELKKTREKLDDNEKDNDFLNQSSTCYLELTKLYNINIINCINNQKLRKIDDINNEIYNCVKSYLMR